MPISSEGWVMSDLHVRRIPFEFDGVDFIWNPENPAFSVMMNSISFTVLGLERYFCRAVSEAEALIHDPAVREEAKLFRMQEGVHASTHHRHAKALIAQYPALQDTLSKAIACFDELYKQRDLKFHLAYASGLEATFTPLFSGLLNNREILFGGGDARVASLFLWHFCEEIEHRSSAHAIYDHIYDDPLYRLRQLPVWFRHIVDCSKMVNEDFKRHVPNLPPETFGDPFHVLGIGYKLRTLVGVLGSQLPWHKPDNSHVPSYYEEWRRRYESGEDMRLTYGKLSQHSH